MASDPSVADFDEDWLYRILPDATDEEVDAFIERVAILVSSGYDEQNARNYAFEGVLMTRAGINLEN